MRTTHALHVGDAASMDGLADGSVPLVVTSPPYPMIELWDDLFAARDPDVRAALSAGDGDAAFELMHAQLDAVWDEIERVLAPGGIACVNVGDATRSVGDEFQQFPNHARVVDAFRDRGLTPLPDVLWRKPTNSLAKFMGSGTLPPNAYVTLEHEYILLFRKGGTRSFPPGDDRRYESAFFWEERNEWFSDLWEVRGEGQELSGGEERRDRSAAFPVEIPLRLIRMFSVRGDRVLDPFAGTGTTMLAAMLAARDSVGYDLDGDLFTALDDRVADLPAASRRRIAERLASHRSAMADRDGGYEADRYDFRVVTKAERRIRLYVVADVRERSTDEGRGYVVDHEPVDGNDFTAAPEG
ncbi:DNA-methyltransferase [Haloplanus pelagicus]|jgi:site-specific DNA-methyltransferase (adenine-specific)|uniref:DNA-methyltransferase n=1 Tax=Haloplanus pelagicus TaxID=2949995 RepID=UPI00203A85FE|nr:site-specific DNA-methyltransferase [Haloplanus sp. HW8-1]